MPCGMREVGKVSAWVNRGHRTEESVPLLSALEVELLSCLLDADRSARAEGRLLRDLLRLCDRHGWARATVELELTEYGTGGGAESHLPLEAGIMSAAMLGVLSARLVFARRRLRRWFGTPRTCPICVELHRSEAVDSPAPHARERAALVNRLTFTRWWLDQTERVWRPVVCPVCLDGSAPRPDVTELCRRHLGERLAAARAELPDVLAAIGTLQDRLVEQTRLAVDGRSLPLPEAAAAASFLALGWLHGWALPLALGAPVTEIAELR